MEFIRRIRKELNAAWVKPGVLVVLSALGIIMLFVAAYGWRYGLSGDGIAYISIAQYYKEGNLDLAVNAYWAPLISWLMVPFMLIGIDGQLAFMLLNALAASIALLLSMLLVWQRTKRGFLPPLLIFFTTIPFYLVSIKTMNPDMLAVSWVVIFSYALLKATDWLEEGAKNANLKAGILIGLMGATGYFTKAFLVPFFFAVMVAWFAIRVFIHRRRFDGVLDKKTWWQFLKMPAIATTVIVMLSVGWIGLLSAKYGKFTVSSSFMVNISSRFSSVETSEGVSKSLEPTKLSVPPNDRAVIWGEDPTPGVREGADTTNNEAQANVVEKESNVVKTTTGDVIPNTKAAILKHYIGQRIKALPYYLNRINSLSPFILPLMFVVFLGLMFRLLNYKKQRDILILSLIWVVYMLGYASITNVSSGGGNLRYYWPVFIVALTILGLVVPLIQKATKKLEITRKYLIVFLISLVPLASFMQYTAGIAYPFSIPISRNQEFLPSERNRPIIFATPQKYKIQIAAEDMKTKELLDEGDDILSNHGIQARLAAFHLNAQSYDRKGANHSLEKPALRLALIENDIEYFFHFASKGNPLPDVSQYGYKVLTQYDLGQTVCNDMSKGKERCTLFIVDVSLD